MDLGDEESGQTIDGQEVLMSRKTVNETSQAHKYLEIPFVMNGLCAVAATQGCAVSKSMIGTCRSDLRLNDDQGYFYYYCLFIYILAIHFFIDSIV